MLLAALPPADDDRIASTLDIVPLTLKYQLHNQDRAHAVPVLLISPRIDDEDIRFTTDMGVPVLGVTPPEGAKLVAAIRDVMVVPSEPRAS